MCILSAHSTAFAPHAQSYLSSSSSFRPREEENHSVVAVTSPSAYAPSVSMPPVCPRYPPSTHTKTPEVSKVSTQGQEGSGVHTPQRTAQEVSSLHPHSHARVSFSSQRQPQAFSQTNAETQHAGMAGSMSSLPPSSARFNASPCSPHPHPAHSSEEEARRRERRKKAEGTKQREEPPDSHASFPGRQDLRAGPGGSLEGGGRIRRSEGQAGREQEGAEEDKREAEEEKGEGGGAKTAEDVDLLGERQMVLSVQSRYEWYTDLHHLYVQAFVYVSAECWYIGVSVCTSANVCRWRAKDRAPTASDSSSRIRFSSIHTYIQRYIRTYIDTQIAMGEDVLRNAVCPCAYSGVF